MLSNAATWATGFDVEPGPNSIVSAVSVRREQLAKNSSQRQQRRLLPSRGLKDVGAQGARVAPRRKHTRSAGAALRAPAQIQKLVEAPIMTPGRQRPPIALNSDTHVSESFATSFADPSSILGAYTSLGLIGPRTDSKCLRRPELRGRAARTARVERRTPVVTGGESAASTLDGAAASIRTPRSPVPA